MVILFSLRPLLEGFHIIELFIGIPRDHVVLFVTWSHLLDEIVSNGVSTCDLGQHLGAVRVHVLND